MTKRELCKRLMEIRDQSSAGHLGPVGIVDALGDLLLDLSDSINYENEKLMEIYKAWEKWDNEPCSSGQRVLAELEADIMEVVHNVMEGIKKEKKDA